MTSANLPELVAFDRPEETVDPYGGVVTTFAEAFRCNARFLWLRGGETVQAARLEGRQPVVVTIRQSALSGVVTTDWRMRDLRRAKTYNIRGIVPTDDRMFLELTCETGVAA
jgi:SPP1 family predicted phage head-tail adaptor